MEKKVFRDLIINYWRNVDKKILISFLVLFTLGLFFSFSSTSTLASERLDKENYFFFSKHLIFSVFAIVLMVFISLINLNIIKKSIIPLFFISLALLILVNFYGIEIKGSRRWLNLYIFQLQPVEILKPFFILVTATLLSLTDKKKFLLNYFLSFLILFIVVILLINQPDIGQSILLIITWGTLIFLSGVNVFLILSMALIFFAFLASLLIILPEKFGYIAKRLSTFLDPEKGDSFQSEKALEAIRQGGLKGRGMGEGILKDSVPEAHTDYIIAVITEEFGSMISILIIFIFLYVAFRVTKICINEKEDYLKISLAGLITILIYQTFIHIGVNTTLLPTTGMTLPFLSYGGSSLIGSSILAGVILNYTKNRYEND